MYKWVIEFIHLIRIGKLSLTCVISKIDQENIETISAEQKWLWQLKSAITKYGCLNNFKMSYNLLNIIVKDFAIYVEIEVISLHFLLIIYSTGHKLGASQWYAYQK